MQAEKINFMAGIRRAKIEGELGLKVGETWVTREGQLVTVAGSHKDGERFLVRREFGFENSYTVNAKGESLNHLADGPDLVRRVPRVYIAGPMSGMIDLNFPAFNAAAIEYRRRGCFVINPAEINGGAAEVAMTEKMTAEQYQAHWVSCMKNDIAALITCDTIILLPGWERSKGATLGQTIAAQLGMTIIHPIDTYNEG